MVLIHIKHKDQSQFLYEATLKTPIASLTKKVTEIYNGRLKVERLCSEIVELAKYGTMYPLEVLRRPKNQTKELQSMDTWGIQCIANGGVTLVKDPTGRRNGRQPRKDMQEILNKSVKQARAMISKEIVLLDKCVTLETVQRAIALLKCAVMTVYPMKLPPHDVIRMEFENIKDISSAHSYLGILDPTTAELWFCGKKVSKDKKVTVGDYVGRIENSKVIMKLCKPGKGPPAIPSVMTTKERKDLRLQAYRRQKDLAKLIEDDDKRYSNSEWTESSALKAFNIMKNKLPWRDGIIRT